MGSMAAAVGRPPGGAAMAGLPVVCWLEECRKDSVALVGGKCSSLGELIHAGREAPDAAATVD